MELEAQRSSTSSTKLFNKDNDVVVINKKFKQNLIDGKGMLTKPFDSGSGYTVVKSEDSNFHVQISNLVDDSSGQSVLSYINDPCKKIDYSNIDANTNNESMMYYSISNLVHGENQYFIDDGNSRIDINSFYLMSLPRQSFKDGIDENAFALFLHKDVNATSENLTGYDSDDTFPLFMKRGQAKNTDYGKKKFLYHKIIESTDDPYYDNVEDTIDYPDDTDISDVIVGEVFLEHGIVLLFPDLLKTPMSENTTGTEFDWDDPQTAGTYATVENIVQSIGGLSHINTTIKKYYIRVLNDEFKFSNNPTAYEDNDNEVYKEFLREGRFTFITKIDLLNSRNETIAQATSTSPILNEVGSEINITANLISY